MLRTVDAIVRAPGVSGADVEVVLFESGPLEARVRTRVAQPSTGCGSGSPPAASTARVSVLGECRFAPSRAHERRGVRLTRRLRRQRPDLVHANSLKAGVIGGVGVPARGHPHGVAPAGPSCRRLHARSGGPTAPVVDSAPRGLRRRELASHTHHGRTARIVPGVRGTRPVPRTCDPPGPPAHPDSEQAGGLRIGMVGRIAPWKGQDRFIDAFAARSPTAVPRR